jgi:nitrate/TMAO reductase-like tetraheme cytochrome c subunit
VEKNKSGDNGRGRFTWIYKTKKGILFVVLPLVILAYLGTHEIAVSYFPEYTCVACHEMKDPVKRYEDSGVAKNHPNCASCHFDMGPRGVWHMNVRAAELFIEHFKRDPNEKIKPAAEPLFLDLDKEPGYYSYVPNHRCFQCKDAKNHHPRDQANVHRKLIKDISTRPCKDCHNHEMYNGQKFYEKVVPPEEQAKKDTVQMGGPLFGGDLGYDRKGE